MYITKNFGLKGILTFSGFHMLWILVWSTAVTALYEFTDWEWFFIPAFPLSVIGTAVAFYVGFKNNQSYDRLWEARKIWGAIVNNSRAWGVSVKGFVSDQFLDRTLDPAEIHIVWQQLLYRHIGWLYALRSQLLIPTSWEHVNQGKHIGELTKKRIEQFGTGLLGDDATKEHLAKFLPPGEYERLIHYKNTATQIIDQQSQNLKQLRKDGLIDDFRHMELQKILNEFYTQQGKAERIKKFPLPRQYGSMSMIFVGIFIFLLPFGMVSAFQALNDTWGIWVSIPFTAVVCWIYLMMELVGDYSENPFEGMGNDIPMLSLCRTIEIDLREMLGETDLPAAVEAKNGILL